jgi:hypothetical protein
LGKKLSEYLKLVLELHPRRPVFGLRQVFFAPFCGVSLREVRNFAEKGVFDEKKGE